VLAFPSDLVAGEEDEMGSTGSGCGGDVHEALKR
jgi:hypothetical protein